MERRPLSYATLTFGITEDRSTKKSPNKKPYKYKMNVDTTVIGESIEEVLKFKPDIENKYMSRFELKPKTKIKLINFKLLHSQGLTTYKL